MGKTRSVTSPALFIVTVFFHIVIIQFCFILLILFSSDLLTFQTEQSPFDNLLFSSGTLVDILQKVLCPGS